MTNRLENKDYRDGYLAGIADERRRCLALLQPTQAGLAAIKTDSTRTYNFAVEFDQTIERIKG